LIVAVIVAVKPVTTAPFVSNAVKFVTLKSVDVGNVPALMSQLTVANSPTEKPDDLMTERETVLFDAE
jgi:hypothetical protein